MSAICGTSGQWSIPIEEWHLLQILICPSLPRDATTKLRRLQGYLTEWQLVRFDWWYRFFAVSLVNQCEISTMTLVVL